MNLINQIAKGNNEALEKLYILYKTKVFRVALVILEDPFLAEDAVQETFMKIKQSAKTFRYGTNEKAWIMTIARNAAIDILNKHKKEIVLESPIEEASEIHNAAESGDMPGDENEGFLQMIQPLNDLDKQIVSLHLISELKHREIAHILNMSVSAVKKRYERAIKRIAHEMEEH